MSAVWVPVPYGVACLFVLDPLVARISFHHRFFFTNPDRLSYHLIQPSPWLTVGRAFRCLSVCLFCQVGEAVGARGASGGGPSGCALLDTGFSGVGAFACPVFCLSVWAWVRVRAAFGDG